MIESYVARLQRLIRDLLDVSATVTLAPEELEIGELIREVVAQHRRALARSGSTLTLNAGVPQRGRWDRERLERAFGSLLENAIKFGRGQPIEVTVGEERGSPAWWCATAGWRRARCSGASVPAVPAGRVARSYGGFGLGLWLVRQVVEAHGGSVRLQSSVADGAAFEVLLPRGEAVSPA